MSFQEKHWPEGATKCDRCSELIEAGWTIWFDDETGESLCEECYDYQVHEDIKEK